MKYIIWLISIFTLILLFPFPLKITLMYHKGIFTFMVFNKTIIPSKGKKAKKKKQEYPEDYVDVPSGEKISKFKIRDGIDIIQFLNETKVKFTLRSNLKIEYAMEDAANAAITYGILHQGVAVIYDLLQCFLKVKKFSPEIQVKYNDNYFNIISTSIIIVSFAKIIYITFFIYCRYIKNRDSSTYESSILKEEF